MSMNTVDRRGTHITHCCVLHGCKYGDSDCPVATEDAVQEYACEWCPTEDSIREAEDRLATVKREVEKLASIGIKPSKW